MVNHFSHVQLFAIPWTVASSRLLCPWDSPGKNTGVCGHLLLQGIFPTQESIQVSPGRQILYLLHYKGRSIPRGVGMIPGRGTWGNSSQNDTMQGLPQGDHCPEEEEGKGTPRRRGLEKGLTCLTSLSNPTGHLWVRQPPKGHSANLGS